MVKRKWTEEEKQYLIKNYRKKTVKQMAKELDRTVDSIENKARKMNLWSSRRWTKKELDYLKDYAGEKKPKDMAKQLVRSVSSIYVMMHKLGLKAKEENHLPVYKAAEKIGVSDAFLYRKIREGVLPCDRIKNGKKDYIFTEEALREFVLEYYPNKYFGCIECSKASLGDIYCEKHIPALAKKEKRESESFVIHTSDENALELLSRALNYLLDINPHSKKEIALKSNVGYPWLNKYINGNQFKFSLLNKIISACGYNCYLYFDYNVLDLSSENFDSSFRTLVRKIRNQKGLTRQELCDMMNKKKRWISNIEDGISKISFSIMKEICDSLNIKGKLEIKQK